MIRLLERHNAAGIDPHDAAGAAAGQDCESSIAAASVARQITCSPAERRHVVRPNWLSDTFHNPLATSGHEANFQGYLNTITIPPGMSRSLLHFLVLGPRVTAATSDRVRAAVESTAASLAATPAIGDLSTAEIWSTGGSSLVTLRGTDGLERGSGIMPLSWLTDFGGVLALERT